MKGCETLFSGVDIAINRLGLAETALRYVASTGLVFPCK
jgi:hypothetical protein